MPALGVSFVMLSTVSQIPTADCEYFRFRPRDPVLSGLGRLLAPYLPQLSERFYSHLQAFPPTAQLLAPLGDLTALKRTQADHWRRLFDDAGTADHAERCRRVGQAHQRIGLAPGWYIGAYGFVLSELQAILTERYRWRPAGRRQAQQALIGALMFDMERTLAVYFDAEEGGRWRDALGAFADTLMDRTINVAVAVNEAAMVNAEMVGRLGEVDREAQTIAASTRQTLGGLNEIASRTREVSAVATEANSTTASGQDSVTQAVCTMDAIAGAVNDAAQRVQGLAEASDQITQIVGAIEAIAKQTNLLALNATIEAARAGDAGKGFAVVASEVKTLANQTARATEDIRTRIAALTGEMAAIIRAMADGTQAVETGRAAMDRVNEQMEIIADATERTNQRMVEISSILSQQSAAAADVSAGITRIAERSSENNRSIQRSVQATKGVEALLGNQLRDLMAQDIRHKVLKIAKVDHLMWKKRLADMLVGLDALGDEELVNPEACRLGKWYAGAGQLEFGRHPAFRALGEPHRQVHHHGRLAVLAFRAGRADDAAAEVERVELASRDVIRLLDELQQPAEGALPAF